MSNSKLDAPSNGDDIFRKEVAEVDFDETVAELRKDIGAYVRLISDDFENDGEKFDAIRKMIIEKSIDPNDSRQLERIIKSYQPFIRKKAQRFIEKFNLNFIKLDDLVQVGNIVLINVLPKYLKQEGNISFVTYLNNGLFWEFLDLLKASERLVPISGTQQTRYSEIIKKKSEYLYENSESRPLNFDKIAEISDSTPEEIQDLFAMVHQNYYTLEEVELGTSKVPKGAKEEFFKKIAIDAEGERHVFSLDQSAIIEEVLDKLSLEEEDLIRAAFGLEPYDTEATCAELGQKLGITSNGVRARIKKILEKLKSGSSKRKMLDLNPGIGPTLLDVQKEENKVLQSLIIQQEQAKAKGEELNQLIERMKDKTAAVKTPKQAQVQEFIDLTEQVSKDEKVEYKKEEVIKCSESALEMISQLFTEQEENERLQAEIQSLVDSLKTKSHNNQDISAQEILKLGLMIFAQPNSKVIIEKNNIFVQKFAFNREKFAALTNQMLNHDFAPRKIKPQRMAKIIGLEPYYFQKYTAHNLKYQVLLDILKFRLSPEYAQHFEKIEMNEYKLDFQQSPADLEQEFNEIVDHKSIEGLTLTPTEMEFVIQTVKSNHQIPDNFKQVFLQEFSSLNTEKTQITPSPFQTWLIIRFLLSNPTKWGKKAEAKFLPDFAIIGEMIAALQSSGVKNREIPLSKPIILRSQKPSTQNPCIKHEIAINFLKKVLKHQPSLKHHTD